METHPESILNLYQQIVTAGLLQYLQKQAGMKVRQGIDSARVVLLADDFAAIARGSYLGRHRAVVDSGRCRNTPAKAVIG